MKSYQKSDNAFEAASKLIPGGVNSPVRAFRSLERNPVFIEKGKGSQITDIDGNKYIDFCFSWGVHILGHANERIIEAAKNAIEKSSSFGAPTILESQLASLIIVITGIPFFYWFQLVLGWLRKIYRLLPECQLSLHNKQSVYLLTLLKVLKKSF